MRHGHSRGISILIAAACISALAGAASAAPPPDNPVDTAPAAIEHLHADLVAPAILGVILRAEGIHLYQEHTMAETIEGGAYRQGDKWVDAAGKAIAEPKPTKELERVPSIAKSSSEQRSARIGTLGTGALAGIDFASDEAAEAAQQAGLTASNFEGATGSGASGGFTKGDVAKLSQPAT